jgi:hypothetical protein
VRAITTGAMKRQSEKLSYGRTAHHSRADQVRFFFVSRIVLDGKPYEGLVH